MVRVVGRGHGDMCAVKSLLVVLLRPILMTFPAFSTPGVWPGLLLGLGYTVPRPSAVYCVSRPISLTFQRDVGC